MRTIIFLEKKKKGNNKSPEKWIKPQKWINSWIDWLSRQLYDKIELLHRNISGEKETSRSVSVSTVIHWIFVIRSNTFVSYTAHFISLQWFQLLVSTWGFNWMFQLMVSTACVYYLIARFWWINRVCNRQVWKHTHTFDKPTPSNWPT